MTSGGEFSTVLVGRVLMGTGHTLSMLAGLTTVLRYRAGPGLASSLNALEFSAMLGVLGGVSLVALLPRAVPWPTAFLLACAPVLVPIVTLPLLRRVRCRRAWTARGRCSRAARPARAAVAPRHPRGWPPGRSRRDGHRHQLFRRRSVRDPAARQPRVRAGARGHRAPADALATGRHRRPAAGRRAGRPPRHAAGGGGDHARVHGWR